MGIDWMTGHEARQAISPAYTSGLVDSYSNN